MDYTQFIFIILITALIIEGIRYQFGRITLFVTVPMAILIIFFLKDASGNTAYTACRDSKKHQAELQIKYTIPFKIKVYYQNGDTEILTIHPIETWGHLDPVDTRITSSRGSKDGMLVPHGIGNGMGGVPISGSGLSLVPGHKPIVGGELKSHWTLNVNGTEIQYGNPIATGVRRFEKL